jgi:hypothetical protein
MNQVKVNENKKIIKDIVLDEQNYKEIIITNQELKKFMEEFLIFLRGEQI